MGLTPEMIKIIKEEIIPELKNEGKQYKGQEIY